MVKQYGQLLRETRARLRPTEGELAAQTARELLAMASGKIGRGAAGRSGAVCL